MAARADVSLERVVRWVAGLNIGYFGVEFAIASIIGSVSLFADSIDFLEDASLNLFVLLALEWKAEARARMGFALAAILLVPGLATLFEAWHKLNSLIPPQPIPLSLTGLGALTINCSCAFMLASYRDHRGSLTRAAFLSARNDAVANIAIIGAGLTTAAVWHSAWPDLIVGCGILIMNADAARQVWHAAREERRRT